jgi:hypothetical protein
MASGKKVFRGAREALLVQLPVPALISQELTGNIPLAGADLVLHAGAQGTRPASEPLLFPREAQNRFGDAALIRQILSKNSAIAGLTCNGWNIERSLYIAGEVKKRDPGIKIWLGGPEVAEDAFFVRDREAPFDLAVEGEGESVFQALISGIEPARISGLFLPGGGRTRGRRRPGLLPDLDSIHDPYIAGLVRPEADKTMFAEFFRGCRYGCHFCRYHQGRAKSAAMRSNQKVREVFQWARAKRLSQIYLLDPSLEQRPGLPAFLDLLARENRSPQIPLFVELRADRIDPGLARKLRNAGVREAEIGLQTASPATLQRLGRSTDLPAFARGAAALKKAGIKLQVDIMLGLPGEGIKDMERTLEFLLHHHLGFCAQIFRTQVFPGTRLRKRADMLGLQFEPRPPYFVLSTPNIASGEMENAFKLAEERLDIRFDPETRPLMKPGHSKAFYPGSGPAWYSFYDLDDLHQRRLFLETAFDDSANAFTLHLKVMDPNAMASLILPAVRKFIQANPFSSLCLLLDHPPAVALDIYDKLRQAFRTNILTNYMERLYGNGGENGPKQRRVLSLLRSGEAGRINGSWLSSLRQVSEIIWTISCKSEAEALAAASGRTMAAPDFLYLDIGEEKIPDKAGFYSGLEKKAADPFGVILPGLDLHWGYVRFQEGLAKARE